MNEQLTTIKNYLEQKMPFKPEVGIILGTGLNDLVDFITEPTIIPYREIPGFMQTTAPSHAGNLVFGKLGNAKVAVMQGRFHFYEGHPMSKVILTVRTFQILGIETLIVTNAAGSLNEDFKPGSLVLLEDHINFMGTNPLIGANDPELGERFPSMNEPYDHELRRKAFEIAERLGFKLHSGVYMAVSGPSMETRAECKAFAMLGADLVGMSTVPEVITARQAGMRVLAISVATNMSNIFHSEAHSQEEINQNAGKAKQNLQGLIMQILQEI
ncbi:MAG TPA: purine-nucleoside phosphorylase [Candidatus Cloacimonadota bacterium]|nr:purine-nucleoside phosphorylase [Candidatus Cloacimonadota bacterium]HPT71017.1 purine-nucleoside phosphorylase [Candidatus Cloacimonadota bacterium]